MTAFVGKRIENTRTIPVENAETVAVDIDLGDVEVTSWDNDDMRVRTVKQSSSIRTDVSKLELRVERSDGRVRLYSEWNGENKLLGGRPSMDLEVDIPASLAVESVETSTGDVSLTEVAGDLSASTSTGDVTARSIDGGVTAGTSTGDITVTDATGTVTADTSTGDIEIKDSSRIGGAEASTGEITVEVPAIDGDTRLETSTGDVTAKVSPNLDAELSVRTSVGDASVSGLELDNSTRDEDSVAGTLGDGGPRLIVESSVGDATVTKLE